MGGLGMEAVVMQPINSAWPMVITNGSVGNIHV